MARIEKAEDTGAVAVVDVPVLAARDDAGAGADAGSAEEELGIGAGREDEPVSGSDVATGRAERKITISNRFCENASRGCAWTYPKAAPCMIRHGSRVA